MEVIDPIPVGTSWKVKHIRSFYGLLARFCRPVERN